MQIRDNYKYTHIATATTTVVEPAPCALIRLTVNTTAAGTITLYDNASAGSGTVIAIMKASIGENDYDYWIRCVNGLTIVTAAASDLTVVTAQAPF